MIYSLKKVDRVPGKWDLPFKIIDAFIEGENDIVKLEIDINDPNFKYANIDTFYISLKKNTQKRDKENEISVFLRSNEIYLKKIVTVS